jgi:hypothetical protein
MAEKRVEKTVALKASMLGKVLAETTVSKTVEKKAD